MKATKVILSLTLVATAGLIWILFYQRTKEAEHYRLILIRMASVGSHLLAAEGRSGNSYVRHGFPMALELASQAFDFGPIDLSGNNPLPEYLPKGEYQWSDADINDDSKKGHALLWCRLMRSHLQSYVVLRRDGRVERLSAEQWSNFAGNPSTNTRRQ